MKNEIRVRTLVVGFLECALVTASSLYVALSSGALPWPTIFVTILSFAILSHFKDFSLGEVTVAHTLASSGAMVAGAIAFTFPGFWILNGGDIAFSRVVFSAVLAALLGSVCAGVFRKSFVKNLEFPIGRAAYETLIQAKNGGAKSAWLFIPIAISGFFTFLRDGLKLIPNVATFYSGGKRIPPIRAWISFMALGIGALIGPSLAFFWLGGGLAANFVFFPIASFFNLENPSGILENVGLGLMVGYGAGVFLRFFVCAILKKSKKIQFSAKNCVFSVFSGLVFAALFHFCAKIGVFASALLAAGIFFASFLAGTLTGETAINPMEIFAILIMTLLNAMFSPSLASSFLIAMSVAIAAGLSGDVMNDLKSGDLIGVDARGQIVVEAAGAVFGAVLSLAILFAIHNSGATFGSERFPTPQAVAVSHLAQNFKMPKIFLVALIVGAILAALGIPAATLGLGVYLPFQISATIGVGAALAQIFKRRCADKTPLIASGLLGGEGIVGVIFSFASMFG